MTENFFANQNKKFFINREEIEKLFNEFVTREVSKQSTEWKDFHNSVLKQRGGNILNVNFILIGDYQNRNLMSL